MPKNRNFQKVLIWKSKNQEGEEDCTEAVRKVWIVIFRRRVWKKTRGGRDVDMVLDISWYVELHMYLRWGCWTPQEIQFLVSSLRVYK